MHFFHSADMRDLLHNKFVVVLGDSIQRSVYKDLVKLLQDDALLSEKQMKFSGGLSFENDTLIEGGELDGMHNKITYREVRQYRSGHHLVRFYFLTRVYSDYLESILSDFQSGPQPDVLIANSCIWDLKRYDDKKMEAYKTNLDKLFQRLKEVLSPNCLIIWTMTMPVGYKSHEMPQNITLNMRPDIVAGNFFSATLANFHKLDVLDMHYHFRCHLSHRCPDKVHWKREVHRTYTHMLLTHITEAWGVEMPQGPTFNNVLQQSIALRRDPNQHHTIQDRAHCSQGAVYTPGYPYFNRNGIRAMSGPTFNTVPHQSIALRRDPNQHHTIQDRAQCSQDKLPFLHTPNVVLMGLQDTGQRMMCAGGTKWDQMQHLSPSFVSAVHNPRYQYFNGSGISAMSSPAVNVTPPQSVPLRKDPKLQPSVQERAHCTKGPAVNVTPPQSVPLRKDPKLQPSVQERAHCTKGPAVNVTPPQLVALRKDPKLQPTVQERAHCSQGLTVNVTPPQSVASRKDPKLQPTVQERAHCSHGEMYIPGYTSFDGSVISATPADSPFVTDSLLQASEITPGYFTRRPGPRFRHYVPHPHMSRFMKKRSKRGKRIHPY